MRRSAAQCSCAPDEARAARSRSRARNSSQMRMSASSCRAGAPRERSRGGRRPQEARTCATLGSRALTPAIAFPRPLPAPPRQERGPGARRGLPKCRSGSFQTGVRATARKSRALLRCASWLRKMRTWRSTCRSRTCRCTRPASSAASRRSARVSSPRSQTCAGAPPRRAPSLQPCAAAWQRIAHAAVSCALQGAC